MKNNRNPLFNAVNYALAAGVAGIGGVSSVALAQDEEAANLDRIEVTGSRIKRTDIEGASPIFVIQREEIERTGLTSVGDLLQDLPVAGSALNTTFNNGGNGETRLDLRGLGCNRLLVLVNGRRWVTGLAGCVDLNNVPVAVIKRIEVLKDGASSVYGSDAIAGVVNIITRDDFDGAQVNAQYGKYLSESDGEIQSYDVSIGSTSDRASVFFNASYVQARDVFAGDRRISQEPQFGTQNSFGSSGTPQGRFGFVNPATGTFSGSWTTDPGCDVAAQGLGCFRVGDFTFGAPGSGADRFNFAPDNYLLTPQERTNIFTQGRYDVTDNVAVTIEASYNKRESEQLLAPTPLFLGLFGSGVAANIGVGALNPFNPTGTALPASSWLLGRRMIEAGPRLFQQNVDSYRFAMGFEGSFEAGNRYWDWNLNYIYGRNDVNQVTEGLINLQRVQEALSDDCATGAIAGCVPLNVFGGANIGTPLGGTMTQAMLDYILFTAQDAGGNDLRNYTANITSELFELPAGPVGFAAGYEWRQETGFDLPDAIISAGITSGNSRQPTRGKTKVKEFYLEFAVPILSGVTGAERLDLSLSSRRSDYDSFGDTTNSKIGLEWQPFGDLLIRGTFAEGFRAPSIIELFRGQGDSFPNLTDPCNGIDTNGDGNPDTNPNDAGPFAGQLPGCAGIPGTYFQANSQIRITVGSNPNLLPEESESKTLGFVYSPSWADGLDLTVDAYDIELQNTITTVGANTIINACASSLVFCNLIQRAPDGRVLDLLNAGVNAGEARVKGVDFLLSYTFPETRAGYFRAVWDGAYQDENSVVALGVDANGALSPIYTNFVGTNLGDFALPRWKSNLDLNWSYGDWDATWGMRYIHGQREACDATSFGAYTLPNGQPYCNLGPDDDGDGVNDFRKLGATTYHDVQISYHVSNWDTRFTFGVNNIFDKGPPLSQAAFANSFDATVYEVPGRFPYVRVTVDF